MQHPDELRSLAGGRYRLLGPLGIGGTSAVFHALDHQRNLHCAVKVLLSDAASKPRARSRFLQEAHTTAGLSHPNIVRVDHIADQEPPYFYAMELASGSLAIHVRNRGPCDESSALGLVLQILRALDHAHLCGVVHRDVKPQNMLLCSEARAVKLTDFGIAKHLDPRSPSFTRPGDALGTLAYMAPEQRTDPRSAGPRADLYGVGATLYHLLTRRRPFDVMMIESDPTVLDRLPQTIRPLVKRATACRLEERFDSALEMAEAVAEVWEILDPAISSSARMAGFRLPEEVTPRRLPPVSWEVPD